MLDQSIKQELNVTAPALYLVAGTAVAAVPLASHCIHSVDRSLSSCDQ